MIQLESHDEARKNTQQYQQDLVLAQLVHKFFKLEDIFTIEDILKVAGIVNVCKIVPIKQRYGTTLPYHCFYDQNLSNRISR